MQRYQAGGPGGCDETMIARRSELGLDLLSSTVVPALSPAALPGGRDGLVARLRRLWSRLLHRDRGDAPELSGYGGRTYTGAARKIPPSRSRRGPQRRGFRAGRS